MHPGGSGFQGSVERDPCEEEDPRGQEWMQRMEQAECSPRSALGEQRVKNREEA